MNLQPSMFPQQPPANNNGRGGSIMGLAVSGLVLVGLAAGGYALYSKMNGAQSSATQTTIIIPSMPSSTQSTQTKPSVQSTQSKIGTQSAQSTQTKTGAQSTQSTQTNPVVQSTQNKPGTQSSQSTQTKTGAAAQSIQVAPAVQVPNIPMPNVDLGPGNYFIQLHKDPNMVIDIENGSKANGAKAIIFTKNGGDNQKFSFFGKTIKAAHSGLVLDAEGELVSGRNIQQWTRTGGDNQRWIPYTDGTIRADADPKMCLDVKNGGGEGTNLIAFECHGGDNQTWDVVKAM